MDCYANTGGCRTGIRRAPPNNGDMCDSSCPGKVAVAQTQECKTVHVQTLSKKCGHRKVATPKRTGKKTQRRGRVMREGARSTRLFVLSRTASSGKWMQHVSCTTRCGSGRVVLALPHKDSDGDDSHVNRQQPSPSPSVPTSNTTPTMRHSVMTAAQVVAGIPPSPKVLHLEGEFPGKPNRSRGVTAGLAMQFVPYVTATLDPIVSYASDVVGAHHRGSTAVTHGTQGLSSVKSGYLKLPDDVGVQVVTSLAGARKAIKRLLSTRWVCTPVPGHGIIGLDTEWQPGTHNPTALLQAATLDAVFLFDLPLLHEKYPKKWPVLARRLLMARNVIKTGYGLAGDLERLAATYPHADCYQCACQVLEVKDLWHHQFGALPPRTQHRKQSRRGLARLVHHALGGDLDKTQQCSSWEDRPLSDDQVAYAALDAHVILQVVRFATDPKCVRSKGRTKDGSEGPWTQWCRTFHYYPHDAVYAWQCVPDELSSKLVHDTGVPVHSQAQYIRAPHALMSMHDAVSFLTRVGRGHASPKAPSTTPIVAAVQSPQALLQRLVKTVAFIVQCSRTQPGDADATTPSTTVPVLAVTGGHRQVDSEQVLRTLRNAHSVVAPGATIRRARFAECSTVFGYEAGRIAPFARRVEGGDATTHPVVVLVDSYFAASDAGDVVYCGVGLPDVLLRMPPQALVTMTGGVLADLSSTSKSSGDDETKTAPPSTTRTNNAVAHATTHSATNGHQATHRRRRRRGRGGSTTSTHSAGRGGRGGRRPTALRRGVRWGSLWGRHHVRFARRSASGVVSVGYTSSSGHSSSARGGGGGGGDSTSSAGEWDGDGNAEALLNLSKLLTEAGLHECHVLRRMLQVHLAIMYGPHRRLPSATRILSDYLSRTQLFLCNGCGNFTLRVLAFIAYKCHGCVPNLAFTTARAVEFVAGLRTNSVDVDVDVDAAKPVPVPAAATTPQARAAGVRQRATMENSSHRLLGSTKDECPNPAALQNCIVECGDDVTLDGVVDGVMARLSNNDRVYLRRMAESLWKCRDIVLTHVCKVAVSDAAGGVDASDSSPTPSVNAPDFQALYAACELLQDIARAGNLYVSDIVRDFTRNESGSFWHVLTCMTLAHSCVEIMAALLMHVLPGHGNNLLSQLHLSFDEAATWLRTLLQALPSSAHMFQTVEQEDATAQPSSTAPSGKDAALAIGARMLVRRALSRGGTSIGNPVPLFRHVGRRLRTRLLGAPPQKKR